MTLPYLIKNVGTIGFNFYEEALHIGELHFIGYCEYVHELQNLYRSLRRKELDFKL